MSSFKQVVIVVEGGGPTGGAERVAFETIELLSENGFKVHIISSSEKIDEHYLRLPGVKGIALGLPVAWDKYFSKNRILSYPLRKGDRSLIPTYKAAFAGLNPNETVVHIHGFHGHFSHLIINTALDLGFRTHLHTHDYGFVCPNSTFFNFPTNTICDLKPLSPECFGSDCMGSDARLLKQFRFRRTAEAIKRANDLTSIVCPSPFTREIIAQTLGDIQKLRVLRCPVHPASTTKSSPELSDVYLWVGRVSDGKDPLTALKAATHAGVTLTVVGEGPQKEELARQFPNHNFLGWKSGEEVAELQRNARCLVLSAAWYETASLVVLESLAAGIPCIIGERSAANSWLTNKENGLTFRNGDADSLAQALEKTKHNEFIATLSQNAFDRYWANPCSRENYFKELMEVYDLP